MTFEVGQKINELAEAVNACEENEEFKGYKASPLLKEMVKLLEDNLEDDKDILDYVYTMYGFVATTYTRMQRASLAAIYNMKALEVALKAYYKYDGYVMYSVDNTLYFLLKNRNYYVDDDCLDVMNKVRGAGLIDANTIENTYERVMARRRSIKNDPVEMSEEYLTVIDEVEEKIDKNRTLKGMGSIHEVWALKAEYLAEKGIFWKSPALLNPNIRFD